MRKYLFFLFVVLVSCKKSAVTTPTPAVLLASMKFTAPNGTGFTTYYDRDANNRLTNIRYYTLNIPLVYNAQGLLTSYGSPTAGQTYLQLTYDTNGNLTGGSAKSYDNSGSVNVSNNFTCAITNGQVSQIKIYDLLSANPTTAENTYNNTYDSNNNLIKQVILDSNGAIIETDNYTFGTNHSPQITNHLKYNLNVFLDGDYFNNNEITGQSSIIPNNSFVVSPLPNLYSYYNQYPIQESANSGYLTGGTYFYTYNGLGVTIIQ